MKTLKYIFFAFIVVIAAIIILSRVPAIQDLIVKKGVERIINAPNPFPTEDALTAVVCGSRGPLPAPDRAETCILVKAGDDMYIVDTGDGSLTNLRNWRVLLNQVRSILFTHLHSDHISNLPDFHLNTWVAQNRPTKLNVYGPEGILKVTEGFERAYELDYKWRNEHHGDAIAPLNVAGYSAHTIDLSDPVIIDNNGLRVTAFEVSHSPVEPALGFRFDYKGRSIVISGDTSYNENLIKYSNNADVLFHDALSKNLIEIVRKSSFDNRPLLAKLLQDILSYHATPLEAAETANQANVKHLILYHLVPAPRGRIFEQVFVKGVKDIRDDWTLARDGTMVILPVGSDEIKITSILKKI